jgi:glutamyl-tRNA synthetase
MEDRVRVRFAPSPTGYLHVGGARTALFNWLFARGRGGAFVLRIEDTDAEKSSAEMVDAITDGLRWLGLDWDEGPIFQSERRARHREAAESLVSSGRAYRCFCPKERIEADRQAARSRGETYLYPGTCRDLPADEAERRAAAGEPHVIRFRVESGETTFTDRVYGAVTVDNATIGDFVLARSDGGPTYHLAVVIDDADMGITHVIRGEDHLSNTPKQVRIYEAIGRTPPVFVHLPVILGPDRRKLSKRHGAASIGAYRDEGILPEALFNFLALLGWSTGDDTELMSREELIAAFSLDRVIRKSAIFDRAKLEWMNGQYFSRCDEDRLVELVTPVLEKAGLFDPRYLAEEAAWYRGVLRLLRDRAHRLDDFVRHGEPFFRDDFEYEPEAVAKRWKSERTVEFLGRARDRYAALEVFDAERIEAATRELAGELEVSAAKLIHPVRVAVTGRAVGPGLFELLALVGREETVRRIDRAIDWLNARPS